MKWEELTVVDFEKAVEESRGVCLLPLGVMEKHGNHLPLGTDLLNIRRIACLAAERESAVVFPPYYFTQIYEAQHQPGTIAIKPRLMVELLEDVCEEIARNQLRKIILLNGHGGNIHFLPFFIQLMLHRKKDYLLYLPHQWEDPEYRKLHQEFMETREHGHACECETSITLASYPGLVKREYLPEEPSTSLGRLDHLPNLYTSVDWYARYPDHYAGDARPASREKGEKLIEAQVKYLVKVIRAVKEDEMTKKLYQEFFSRMGR